MAALKSEPSPETQSDKSKDENETLGQGEITTLEELGHAQFHRLGWKRLTVVLLVEAIALGALLVIPSPLKL